MTPKEKAIELVEKYNLDEYLFYSIHEFQARKCALIAVDEILKAVDNPDETYLMKHSVNYWKEVKQEIKAL